MISRGVRSGKPECLCEDQGEDTYIHVCSSAPEKVLCVLSLYVSGGGGGGGSGSSVRENVNVCVVAHNNATSI